MVYLIFSLSLKASSILQTLHSNAFLLKWNRAATCGLVVDDVDLTEQSVVLSVEDPGFPGGVVLIPNSLIVQFCKQLHENVNSGA